MPLTQRVPKLRGFYNRFRVEYQVVNCAKLSRFAAGTEVDADALRKAGLVRRVGAPVKLLAGGSATIPALTLRVNRASRAAIEVIRAAGGEVVLIAAAPPAEEAADSNS